MVERSQHRAHRFPFLWKCQSLVILLWFYLQVNENEFLLDRVKESQSSSSFSFLPSHLDISLCLADSDLLSISSLLIAYKHEQKQESSRPADAVLILYQNIW